MMDKNKLVNLLLKFSPDSYHTLEKMALNLGITKAEVMGKAISILSYVIEENKKGNQFIIVPNEFEFVDFIFGKRKNI